MDDVSPAVSSTFMVVLHPYSDSNHELAAVAALHGSSNSLLARPVL